MQIGGESEGEVGEDRSGSGGVEVADGGATGEETVEEADRNRGGEAEEESENCNGDSDG